MKNPLENSLADILADGAEAGLPVPDTAEPMIGRSLRLPVSVSQQLEAEARARGIGPTVLARQLIEAGLADLHADTAMVPLAEVRRLLAGLARRTSAA
jgi:hypothetical protein